MGACEAGFVTDLGLKETYGFQLVLKVIHSDRIPGMGLLLGLISYFGWGMGDIFGVYASRKIGAYRATAYVFIFGFLIASLYVPWALPDFGLITAGLFALNFMVGSIYLSGNVLLNEGFSRSSASLVGIIVQSFPAVTLVLSALIFKDSISVRQVVWVSLIFLGVFLCSVEFEDLKKKKLIKDKGIMYALIAAIIFSLYFTFLRVFADAYGWFWSNYISFASFPLALLMTKKLFAYKERIGVIRSTPVLLATFMSGLLLRGGDVALNVGIAGGFSAVVAPLAGAAPTLFVVLSSLIYKDPVSRQQKFGIGLSLAGILLLSFAS